MSSRGRVSRGGVYLRTLRPVQSSRPNNNNGPLEPAPAPAPVVFNSPDDDDDDEEEEEEEVVVEVPLLSLSLSLLWLLPAPPLAVKSTTKRREWECCSIPTTTPREDGCRGWRTSSLLFGCTKATLFCSMQAGQYLRRVVTGGE